MVSLGFPLPPHLSADGGPPWSILDDDQDGWSNGTELDFHFTDPIDPLSVPQNAADSDGDHFSDEHEEAADTDPMNPLSYPGAVDSDEALDNVMEELYTAYAAGQIPLSKLPTIAQMKKVMGGLGKSKIDGYWMAMLEKHHVVPTYVQKYFDLLNPNHTLPRKNGKIDFDKCPGLSLWWEEHRGTGDSVHGLMRGEIPEKFEDLDPNWASQELFDALDNFYDDILQRPGASKAIREYLNQHGLP